jgi:hypothetical protein
LGGHGIKIRRGRELWEATKARANEGSDEGGTAHMFLRLTPGKAFLNLKLPDSCLRAKPADGVTRFDKHQLQYQSRRIPAYR